MYAFCSPTLWLLKLNFDVVLEFALIEIVDNAFCLSLINSFTGRLIISSFDSLATSKYSHSCCFRL